MKGAGVVAAAMFITSLNGTALTLDNSVLGNSIYSIGTLNYPNFGNSNLGIDLITSIENSDPVDLLPDSFEDQGPSPNTKVTPTPAPQLHQLPRS